MYTSFPGSPFAHVHTIYIRSHILKHYRFPKNHRLDFGVEGSLLFGPFDIVGVVRPEGVDLPRNVGVVRPVRVGVEVLGVGVEDVLALGVPGLRDIDEDLGVGVFDRETYVGVGCGVVDLAIVLLSLEDGVDGLRVLVLVGELTFVEELLNRFVLVRLPVDPI